MEEVSGIKKAAILMISLGPEASAEIMKILPDRYIQKISYEIANIDYVRPDEREQIISEFLDMYQAREYISEGGIDYAKDLLNKALGAQRAKEIIDMLNQIQLREKPFNIARRTDTAQLATLLKGEHPQTVALILSYIQPEKAAEVLAQFEDEEQIEIAERIGTMSGANPTIIEKIEQVMENKFSNFIDNDTEATGGVHTLVEILNVVGRSTEKVIITELEKSQPELAEEVKASLFTFEDIATLATGDVQKVLREIDHDDLVMALKGVSEHLREFIFQNVSARAAESLREDIEFVGPARLSVVEEAQTNIVTTIRRLDDQGEIYIRRGDQDAIIN